MSFDIDHHDGIEVVHLNVARLDINTSRQLKALMDNQSIKPGDRVILDFDGVQFLDSTGLGMLVQVMNILLRLAKWYFVMSRQKPLLIFFT